MSRTTATGLRVALALGLSAGLLVPVAAQAEDAAPVTSASAVPEISATHEASTSPNVTREAAPTRAANAPTEADPDPVTRASAEADPDPVTRASAERAAVTGSNATAEPSASAAATSAREPAPGLVAGGRVTSFGLRAAAAGPATSTDPALVGAHFLEQELIASDYLLEVDFGSGPSPQWGLVADSVLALAAAGTGQVAGAAATEVLASNVVNYTGFGDPSEVYAGATAKLLNVAVAQHVDPTKFGGFDLVATLQGLRAPNGRFSDQSAYGDYSNVLGQSLAIIGLTRAASVDDSAVDYLKAQQCSNGGFPTTMADTGCTEDITAEVDATAFAVQALLVADGSGSAAAQAGLDFLAAEQGGTGGFDGGSLQPTDNANSTGLAAQALLAGGRSAQERRAIAFLTPLQLGCPLPEALRGAIAYDQAGYDALVAAGSAAEVTDQERRVTSQALLAFAGVPLGAVTNAGATAQAPALDCAGPAPTPTPTPTATSDEAAPADPAPTESRAPEPIESPTTTPQPAQTDDSAQLAATGATPLAPASLGVVLLLAGLGALLLSRRRGAHQ